MVDHDCYQFECCKFIVRYLNVCVVRSRQKINSPTLELEPTTTGSLDWDLHLLHNKAYNAQQWLLQLLHGPSIYITLTSLHKYTHPTCCSRSPSLIITWSVIFPPGLIKIGEIAFQQLISYAHGNVIIKANTVTLVFASYYSMRT